MSVVQRYDRRTIVLHWLTAVFVGGLWIVGQTADYLPEDSLIQSIVWSSHVTSGFLLAAILVARVAWRSTSGTALPPADRGVLQILAKTVHVLLYVLLAVTIALGIANAFIRGYDMFHLFHLPQLGDKDWKKPVTEWHGLAANTLLALAVVHAAAGLVHHYVWRDGLLSRMSLSAR